jgi:hypothetical protein
MKQGFFKKEEKYWAIFFAGILLTICLTSFWVITKNPDAFINLFTKFLDPGPVGRFMRITGYDWPESANVVSTGNDDKLFDWEFYIVFEADDEQLEKWLSSPPPWDIGEWSAGPVPFKVIGSSFGMKGITLTRYDSGVEEYGGDEKLINLVISLMFGLLLKNVVVPTSIITVGA